MGRPDEAKKEVKIARELDPLAMIILRSESWIYGWSDETETARKYYERNIKLYPEYKSMYADKANFHFERNEFKDAFKNWLKMAELDQALEEILNAAKIAMESPEIKDFVKVMLDYDLSQDPVNVYFVAGDYYMLGDYERSLDWLERAYDTRQYEIILINQDPLFSDPKFRSNPRFQAILKKMNFPEM